jgi:hypothetical protein
MLAKLEGPFAVGRLLHGRSAEATHRTSPEHEMHLRMLR